jgi:hypothetical protein
LTTVLQRMMTFLEVCIFVSATRCPRLSNYHFTIHSLRCFILSVRPRYLSAILLFFNSSKFFSCVANVRFFYMRWILGNDWANAKDLFTQTVFSCCAVSHERCCATKIRTNPIRVSDGVGRHGLTRFCC